MRGNRVGMKSWKCLYSDAFINQSSKMAVFVSLLGTFKDQSITKNEENIKKLILSSH